MANMCANFLFIIGGEEFNKKSFIESFKTMEQKEKETKLYQFPQEIEETPENTHSLCDFVIDEGQETLSFLSRWSNPTELLKDMGKHHKVSFRCDFDEGTHYYGAIFYYHKTDSSKEVMLDEEDLSKYEEEEDEEVYIYKGELYHSESEVLDLILEEKIQEKEVK